VPEAVGKDGGPEFLHDDLAEIILKCLGDPAHHGHADEDAKEFDDVPNEFGLGARARLLPDLLVTLGHEMTVFIGVIRQMIQP